MMAMSNNSVGVVRHLTCLRWANVDMPLNAHYGDSWLASHKVFVIYNLEYAMRGLIVEIDVCAHLVV